MCADMALLLPGTGLRQWGSPALGLASVTAGARLSRGLGSTTQLLDFSSHRVGIHLVPTEQLRTILLYATLRARGRKTLGGSDPLSHVL